MRGRPPRNCPLRRWAGSGRARRRDRGAGRRVFIDGPRCVCLVLKPSFVASRSCVLRIVFRASLNETEHGDTGENRERNRSSTAQAKQHENPITIGSVLRAAALPSMKEAAPFGAACCTPSNVVFRSGAFWSRASARESLKALSDPFVDDEGSADGNVIHGPFVAQRQDARPRMWPWRLLAISD